MLRGFVWTILCCLCINFSGIAQTDLLQKSIELSDRKYRVSELLRKELPKHKITLFYHDNIVPLRKSLYFDKTSVPIKEILEAICYNENLSYEIRENQILLKYYDRPDREYKYTISGRIKEKGTGESLVGATVLLDDFTTGVITNGYGFYSLTLSKGVHKLHISYIGHEPREVTVDLNKDVLYDIQLSPKPWMLNDVTISETDYFDLKIQNMLSSSDRLDIQMLEKIPYLGEVDVFQGTLLLPGVTNTNEGALGINVRGGSVDQNLIMLDEAVIYNSNHFFGLISVFNPDAVKDVEILKGDMPASYGGRVSSAMHIRQKEGNNESFHVSGGIGLITSRLMVEGPIKKGRSSFLLSGRSTFWDLILRNTSDPTLSNIRANFQDLNAKMKFNINSRNNLYVSGYYGSDANKLGLDALKKWGNRLVSVRWNRVIKNKHFSNLTSYFSQYEYRVIEESETADFVGTSRISDVAVKWDLTSYATPNNIFDYGASVIFHRLDPGIREPGVGSSANPLELPAEHGFEPSLYVSNERRFGKFSFELGLRLSSFSNIGKTDVLVYDKNFPKSQSTVIDTLIFENGETTKLFYNILPRVSAKYQMSDLSALKMSFTSSVQYMHLLSNTLSPSSSDLWKISGQHLSPTTVNQTTVGYYKVFKDWELETSFEAFYRTMDNLVEYKNGADLSFNQNFETELLSANGHSFGIEVFMKKKIGRLTGWVGYTWSKAEKRVNSQFAEETINNGEYFPMDQDRRHDVAISGIYQLTDRISISSNFVFNTGRPFTFPDSKYDVDGIQVPHYPDRNRQRLDNYHRLDLSLTLKLREVRKNGKVRKDKSSWVFSLYNVYARRNTQAYFFSEDPNNPGQSQIERYSILGTVIPSVTYNFKF